MSACQTCRHCSSSTFDDRHSRTSVDNVLEAESDINSDSDPEREVLMDPEFGFEGDEEGQDGKEGGVGKIDA